MRGEGRAHFLTVGLHPAIDRTIKIPRLTGTPVLRGQLVRVEAAGKSANMAHTLSNFRQRVIATGFLGAAEAGFFLKSFDPKRVETHFVPVASPTRESITLLEERSGTRRPHPGG